MFVCILTVQYKVYPENKSYIQIKEILVSHFKEPLKLHIQIFHILTESNVLSARPLNRINTRSTLLTIVMVTS